MIEDGARNVIDDLDDAPAGKPPHLPLADLDHHRDLRDRGSGGVLTCAESGAIVVVAVVDVSGLLDPSLEDDPPDATTSLPEVGGDGLHHCNEI